MAQFNDKLSVFVDLDNTIVYQSPFVEHPVKEELEKAGADPYKLSVISVNQLNKILPDDTRAINAFSQVIVVRRRPHAEEFLTRLKALVGPICCLTMGTTGHQKRVLEASGLAGHFEILIGRDKYNTLVPQKGKNWMLIDDLTPHDQTCATKLNGLGVVSERSLRVLDITAEEELAAAKERMITVPSYEGQKEDDGLLRVWNEVEAKIRTLGRLIG
jgi:phosphoglycolate phosphatase-like HAD superfamily hydrolase